MEGSNLNCFIGNSMTENYTGEIFDYDSLANGDVASSLGDIFDYDSLADGDMTSSLAAAIRNPYPYDTGSHSCFDSLIESELSRLALTSPSHLPASMVPPTAYYTAPPSPRFTADINYMRIQSAAMAQPQSYQHFDNSGNSNAYNLNNYGVRNLDLIYGSQTFLNGFRSSPVNRNMNNHSQYRPLSTNRMEPESSMAGIRPRNRPIFSRSRSLRGRVVSLAKDQHGCKILQKKLEEGRLDHIQTIFMEVKDHVCELMVHQFGNYLIQKILEVCDEQQMNQLLMRVTNNCQTFREICTDIYGTRTMQKLLERMTTSDQKSYVTSMLRGITISLAKNMNGHHVIQHCLEFFSVEYSQYIINEIANNCLDIAMDKSGCCIFQQCLRYAVGEPQMRLIAQITSNAVILSHHPYGNYVVQYVIDLKSEHWTQDLSAHLSGNFVSLSMDKFASNVVERFLEASAETLKLSIIDELTGSPHFLRVLQDPYGNYVAQAALKNTMGAIRQGLLNNIAAYHTSLHSHPHGKRVLSCIKDLNLTL